MLTVLVVLGIFIVLFQVGMIGALVYLLGGMNSEEREENFDELHKLGPILTYVPIKVARFLYRNK